MAARKDGRPIIVIRKKKVVAGGHHGGSWKVAYADFVTAMMAFFLVMWIIGMDDQTKQAIEGYFSNPVGYKRGYSAGASPLSSGNSPSAIKRPPVRLVIRAYEQKRFEDVSNRLEKIIQEAQGAQQLWVFTLPWAIESLGMVLLIVGFAVAGLSHRSTARLSDSRHPPTEAGPG